MIDDTSNIIQIPKCLPDDIVENINNYVNGGGWKYGWRSNSNFGYAHWNQDFIRCIMENGLDCESILVEPLKSAWSYIKTTHFPNHRLIRCYANAHTFGVEGYPHTDSKRENDLTLVLYLNKKWLREWGGETVVYDDKNIVHTELPEFNNGLVFPGNKFHAAKSVSRICPELRVTLMFKMSKFSDYKRDSLQAFLQTTSAQTTQHTNGTLIRHLLRVYDLLKSWGYDDDTCLGGGLHSVFGTNVFKTKTVISEDRGCVVEFAGENATNLAELFGTISRPKTLEDALINKNTLLNLTSGIEISVTEEQLNSLCAIEAANLFDQNVLKPYENISKFVNSNV